MAVGGGEVHEGAAVFRPGGYGSLELVDHEVDDLGVASLCGDLQRIFVELQT